MPRPDWRDRRQVCALLSEPIGGLGTGYGLGGGVVVMMVG
jgi:hypothetical protein